MQEPQKRSDGIFSETDKPRLDALTDAQINDMILSYRQTGNADVLMPLCADVWCFARACLKPFGSYALRNLEQPELVSIAWISLINTVSATTATNRVEFFMHYKWQLLEAVVTELSNRSDAPVSRALTYNLYKLRKARRRLKVAGTIITDDALREESGLGRREFKNACQAEKLQFMLRLDAPTTDSEGDVIETYADTIPDTSDHYAEAENDMLLEEIRIETDRLLQALPPRQEAVLRLVMQGLSISEAGMKLGISSKESRSAYDKALRTLRRPHNVAKLSRFTEVNMLTATSLRHYRITGYSSPERVVEDLLNNSK